VNEDNPKRLKSKGERTYSTSVVNLPERNFFKETTGTDWRPPQSPEQSNPKED
jgi:hypothetical protein